MAAACGERLYVAEGGTLRVNSYQASGAGYYIVIHGAISGTDYVYMHMQAPSWAPANTTVYTGQQIGRVGSTGTSDGLPPPLRALERPRLVRRRRPLRSAAGAPLLGLLLRARDLTRVAPGGAPSHQMGATGLEPVTSSLSSWRSPN